MDKKSPHYEDIVEIENAAQRCKTIVTNLLDFARAQPTIGSDKKPEEIDVNEALEGALNICKVGAAKEVVFKNSLEEPGPLVSGNKNKLMQVIVNIVQNSFHAMEDGGTLTIKSWTKGDKVCFSIADTGIGIDKESQKRIFDPFYTTKGIGEGTGLGLSIVHGIIEEMGGTIEVKSSEEVGTEFTITFAKALKQKAS